MNETTTCEIPGHALVPRDPVDPHDLVKAGTEMVAHLNAAITEVMKARADWVSRGLPAEGFASSWVQWCDGQAWRIIAQRDAIARWTKAARTVAERRSRSGGARDE